MRSLLFLLIHWLTTLAGRRQVGPRRQPFSEAAATGHEPFLTPGPGIIARGPILRGVADAIPHAAPVLRASVAIKPATLGWKRSRFARV